jgi:SAM-dependent methyltransferase
MPEKEIRKMGVLKLKPGDYYDRIRPDIIALIEGKNNVILDVGCGSGVTSAEFVKSGLASTVIGIEISSQAALRAKSKIDRVICCDIENSPLRCRHYFDYIVLADVLEHLRYPNEVLEKFKETLKPAGRIVACLPNIRNWRIIRDLVLYDKFEYAAAGILDQTHLRFFTLSSAEKLFSQCGYRIIHTKLGMTGPKHRCVNSITFGILKRFIAYSIYIIACEKN